MEVQVHLSSNHFEKSRLERLNRLLLKNPNDMTDRERRFIDYTSQMINDFVFENSEYFVSIEIGEFEGKMYAEPKLKMHDHLEPSGVSTIATLCYDVEVKTRYEFSLEDENTLHTFIWEITL